MERMAHGRFPALRDAQRGNQVVETQQAWPLAGWCDWIVLAARRRATQS
jgi:hypothetical protein